MRVSIIEIHLTTFLSTDEIKAEVGAVFSQAQCRSLPPTISAAEFGINSPVSFDKLEAVDGAYTVPINFVMNADGKAIKAFGRSTFEGACRLGFRS